MTSEYMWECNDKESTWILEPIKIQWTSMAPLPKDTINGTRV